MEELNFGQMMFTLFVCVFAVELLTALLLSILSVWLEFTLRKKFDTYDLGSWWVHKYHKLWGADRDHTVFDFVISVFTTFILLAVPAIGYFFTGGAIITVIGISIVLGIIFAPRFVIDIIKSLKYNVGTGESESIEELKAKVKALERKSKQ